jgi:hypothetical protein
MTGTAVQLLAPDELAALVAYAERLAAAELLPPALRKKPANVLLVLEYGRALGLPPAAAIQQVAVVDGRPQISATLAATLARRAGHRLRVTADDDHAVAQLVRHDDPDHTFEVAWDVARAERAGLAGRGAWKQYPRQMLTARATLEVVRVGAPEVLVGLHGVEELADTLDAPAGPQLDGEPLFPPRPADDPAGEPVDAEVVDDPPVHDWPPQERPSPRALRALGAAMRAAGHVTPDAMRDAAAAVLGRPVAHAGQLSAGEVDRVLVALAGQQP